MAQWISFRMIGYALRCYHCTYGDQIDDYGRCQGYSDRGIVVHENGYHTLCVIKLGNQFHFKFSKST